MKSISLFAGILLVGAVQIGTAQIGPYGLEKPSAAVDRTSLTASDRLRQEMRKLWSDHVFWTRDYAAAAIADQSDQDAAAKRLLKNQEDIGNAVGQYYGTDAGAKLTNMLKEHILIAVDLIKAAKTHNDAKFQEADRKWDRNAEDIADFLTKANPNWPKTTLTSYGSQREACAPERDAPRKGSEPGPQYGKTPSPQCKSNAH